MSSLSDPYPVKPASPNPTAAATGSGESVTKRLQRELMQLMMSGDSECSAFPEGDNLFEWVGSITGASSTVYDKQTYKLSLKFPSDYPYSPPTLLFITPIYHPNVDTHGNICLDILKENWSAAYNVQTLLVSLRSLLAEPNVDSPLNSLAANMWKDEVQYRKVNDKKYEEAIKSQGSSSS